MTSLGSGALLCGGNSILLPVEGSEAQGELLDRLGFVNEGAAEMGTAFGSELDGRLYTALDGMDDRAVVTPEEGFYLRTRASQILPVAEGWQIAVDGLTAAKRSLKIAELREREKPLGLHLMECAGNTRAAHFGMISVGDWAGAPAADLLEELRPLPSATRVLVSGFDKYVESSATSVAGASWIFAMEELRAAGAFLATKLGGKPLSRDHGAPVRLVVPGWYGCTCIKWVDRITFVDETAEATSQMLEYAARTHQNGSPRLAKDFLPARIDHAAMPIRVEKWREAGQLRYRVVGLLWGGSGTVKKLGIRFNPEEEYVPVEPLRVPQTTPWTLWSHTWRPAQRGRYTIRLTILEPSERPKRLEAGYYARSVEIEEV
ncbi:MAG TPA: molybdopterin-dependent oxidoreductase [Candidatus Eisenbacteria bacterium]|nr:molybdopterin-dependent oxidoreductase [Candidatus Eisenbacteria bacterium]